MKFIKNLNEIRKSDLNKVGGKAANLGEMIYMNLPVPEGFVILTNAYIEFIKENKLDQKIKSLLNNIENDSKKLEEVSKKIKLLFEKETIPEKIKIEIKKAYESLKNESLVVRSSATAEDLPGLSFAGQYNTYLNINGYLSLEKHIKKCWASLWNSRAISYRIQQKINDNDLAHGVVVQKLINSKKSGILFTANPLNGKRDELLINSSWGLGEAIVGGEVNPDQWIINKNTKKIINEKIASKELMSVRKKEGIDLVKVNSSLKNKKTLNQNEINKLLDLAVKTEKYYNYPQDLEWAFDKKFYLVQTRPITSIYPLPKKNKEGLRVYLNINNYSQAMKEPFTPLGEDLITTSIKKVMSKYGRKKLKENSLWWYHITAGRIFIDITAFLRIKKLWKKFKKTNPNDKDPITTKILLQTCEKNKKELLSKKEKIKFKKLINLRMLRFILSASFKFCYGIFYPKKARIKSEEVRIKTISKLKEKSLKLKTKEEKINFIKNNISNLLVVSIS